MAMWFNSIEFGGEEYLTIPLPDYSRECWILTIKLVAISFFWIVVLPYTFSLMVCEPTVTSRDAPKLHSKPSSTKKRRDDKVPEPEEELSVNIFVTVLAAIGCMASICYVLINNSPYNWFIARGVFQVPVLTKDECNHILQMADAAANRNYQAALEVDPDHQNTTVRGLLQEPQGWQKFRHGHYQTTDMNLITDPFAAQDLAWLKDKLDDRLAPVLERIYGIPRASIRANDMFVVRYDAGHRAHLARHMDDSDVSFNILLTDDFVGGGTRFWDRTTETAFAHLQPERAGQLVTHSATISHEGVHITEGSRVILVGFLSLDKVDPFNAKPTGLSAFASWMSIPWMHVKFREAQAAAEHRIENGLEKWSNNKYVQALFLDMANLLEELGDFFCSHHAHNLVREQDTEDYLQSLDRHSEQSTSTKASWFSGQQVQIDIDGRVSHEYPTRRRSKDKFRAL